MISRFTIAALLMALGAGTAIAQEGGRHGPMSFETLDADGDGEVTAEDFEMARAARFGEIDADGDGSVSEAEFVAHAARTASERAARMFERLDADGDGVLSRDVMERGRRGGMAARLIERFDSDGSGGLSEAEFDVAAAEMRERHGGRRGRGRRH